MNKGVAKVTRGGITAAEFLLQEFPVLYAPILLAKGFLKIVVLCGVLNAIVDSKYGFRNPKSNLNSFLFITVPILILYFAPKFFNWVIYKIKEKSNYLER